MIFSKIDFDALENSDTVEVGGVVPGTKEYLKSQLLISHPDGLSGIESFEGGSTFNWSYWYDEFHIVKSGRALIRYSVAPFHDEVLEQECGPDTVYFIPNGARVTFETTEGEPFVHYWVVMPNFGMPPGATAKPAHRS